MIYLALPNYGSVEHEVIKTVIQGSKNQTHLASRASSMLPDNFNVLWCEFMNGYFSHFVMLHADITSEPLWIDKLLSILDEKEADVVSAVIPIKDATGDTSTAFLPDDSASVQRLSLKEIQKLPTTFNEKDVGELLGKNGTLLVNTGLWIAKKGEWCKDFTGFRMITEAFFSQEKGKWHVRRISEDWEFSMWAKKHNVKIFGTRAIRATHIGKNGWRNYIET